MSYILDALRRSDQERSRGAPPALDGVPFVPAARQARRPWMPVAVTLAVVAAFALGALRPWQSESRPAGAAPVALAHPVDTAPSIAPDTKPHAPLNTALNAAPQTTPKPAPRPAAASPAAALAAPPDASSATPAAAANARPSKDEGAAPSAAVPVKTRFDGNEKIPALSELPAALREQLPPLTVTMHSYSSNPRERLLGVNDKVLHEGEAVGTDLVLERITPEGMIMSYKGTRFRRGVR